jgi:hypothetical protein
MIAYRDNDTTDARVNLGRSIALGYELDNIYAEIDRRWAAAPEDNAAWHALMDRAAAIRAELRKL